MTTLVVLAFAIPLAFLHPHRGRPAAPTTTTEDQARNIALTLRNGPYTAPQITPIVTAQTADSGRPVSVLLPDGTRDRHARRAAARPLPPAEPARTVPGDGPRRRRAATADRAAQPGAAASRAAAAQLATAVAPIADRACYVVRVYLSNERALRRRRRLVPAARRRQRRPAADRRRRRRGADPADHPSAASSTAETAQQLSVGDTTARAPTDGPREVAEVGMALNRLADRIDELIAEERETVADLSHRLRTPLTTLRLDAEALRDPDRGRAGRRARQRARAHAHRGDPRRAAAAARGPDAVVRRDRGGRRAGRVLVGADRRAGPDQHGHAARPTRCRCARPPRISPPPSTRCSRTSSRTRRRARRSRSRLAATDDGARLEIADDGAGHPRGGRGARPQRPRLDRARPRHRPALRRGVRRVDDDRPLAVRRRAGHARPARP